MKLMNTVIHIIKMKPADVKSKKYVESGTLKIIEIPNLKLAIFLEYQNIKIFLEKVTLQIDLKKFLRIKKSKMLCHGHTLLVILMEKTLLESFTKTNFGKQIKKNLELLKVIKRKSDKL